MLTFEEWRHTYADVFETDDAARAAWTAASNKGYSAGVQDTRELLAAHSAGAQEPVRWEIREQYDDGNWSAWMICSKVSADHYKQFPNKEIRPLYTHPQPMTQTDAARDVLAERARQVNVEGWTAQHDDEHDPGDLCAAGSAYALAASDKLNPHSQGDGDYGRNVPDMWPENWHTDWWKLTTPRRDLIKAAALILAEIERLDRSKGE